MNRQQEYARQEAALISSSAGGIQLVIESLEAEFNRGYAASRYADTSLKQKSANYIAGYNHGLGEQYAASAEAEHFSELREVK